MFTLPKTAKGGVKEKTSNPLYWGVKINLVAFEYVFVDYKRGSDIGAECIQPLIIIKHP